MVSFHHTVLGGDGAAFNQRQQVTLNAFTGYIRAGTVAATLTDFVDFVDKRYRAAQPHRLHLTSALPGSLQFCRFFFDKQLQCVLDFQLTRFLLLAARFWNMDCNWLVISSIPGGAMISTPIGAAARSISISLSSSCPSRSFLRNAWRAADGSACCSDWPQLFQRWDQHVENALFSHLFGTIAVFSRWPGRAPS